MKRAALLQLFIALFTILDIQGATWTAPTATSTGIPPTGTTVYFYHTGQQKFLTKGTTWDTHTALTSDFESALPYVVYDLGNYQRLHSSSAGNTGYLFLSNSSGDPYTDLNTQSASYSYWQLQELSNGHFHIAVAAENGWSSSQSGFLLGWNPSNIDKDQNGSSLGTNIGIFALSPSDSSYETEWTYLTAEQLQLYKQRCILEDLLEQATSLNIDTDAASAVYEDPSSTLPQVRFASVHLQLAIEQARGSLTTNISSYIINPKFNGNVSGWTINTPGAQNKGYQGASYTNKDITISQFAEAWIPAGRTLGAGEISQTLTGLPEGQYVLEADVIACNQNGSETIDGAVLFARNQTESTQPISTLSGKPQHFSLSFTHDGSDLTLGLQTLASTTANWVAIDNVRLIYYGIEPLATTDDPTPLIVNELQTANIDMFIDPSYNYGGWVELYNPTSNHINLSGTYVSNEPLTPLKHQLPADFGFVPAHGFRVIWFDHYATDDSQSNEAYKQVPFKLDYEGGTLYFSTASGTPFLTHEYPPAIQRTSHGRTTDGGATLMYCSTPTPGRSNNGSDFASQQLSAPEVDRDACLFSSSFTANVTIPAGATLRYTTDGSTPTLSNGTTSSDGVFPITQTTVLRFRLFKEGMLPSSVVTRSYIQADRDYYLPIVSIVADPKNLFDDTIGIYVDGTNGTSGNNKSFSNKNRNWERPVNFELLTQNQEGEPFLMSLNQECDFEVCGGWSRHFAPASSFRLKAGKYYLGKNHFPYTVFKDKPYIKNKTLQIRNGGNDNNARIKDAAIHQILLTSDFYVDCQTYQPAHVFINGEYKFMFNIREPNNKNHGYSNYGIDTDLMDQFEINGTKGYEQKAGDDAAFRRWMALTEQLAQDPENEELYRQICDMVDMDEYINYMAAECYIGSSDWLTNSNNAKGFREKKNGSKFHLVLMDVDAGFSYTNMINRLSSSLEDSRYDTGKNFLIDIFLNMLQNSTFRKRFIDAFCLVNGSVFEPQRSTEIITAMANKVDKALGYEGNSNKLWESSNNLINTISNSSERTARINNMSNYFGLSDSYNVSLDCNMEVGRLLLNGQEIPTNKFTGQLFAPITFTAKTPSGYRFKGWHMDGATSEGEPLFSTSDTWKYYDQGSLDNSEWKSASYSDTNWKTGSAPLGYGNVGLSGSADYNTTLSYGNDSSNKYPTYYFRKTFNLDQAPTDDDQYMLTYYVDDGFIAYVNGIEVGRYLMSDGNASYSQYSTSYVGSTAATATITIDNSILKQGENVISVEVHNTSATSSDIYWSAKLTHVAKSDVYYISTDEDFTLSNFSNANAYTITAEYELVPDEEQIPQLGMPVKVNEVSAGNTIFANDTFNRNDWIELYNNTDHDLDLAGLYISDDPDDVLKYQIPSGSVLNTIIPAHGHRIIWADNLEPVTQLHTTFSLSNVDDQIVMLTSSNEFVENNASFFESHPALKSFVDGLPYDSHQGNQTIGRYPDGGKSIFLMNRPTIDKHNSLLSSDKMTATDEGIMEETSVFSLALGEGWNWVSHPFSEALNVNDFKEHVDRIMGQTLESWYNDNSQSMEGPLKTLQTGTLYKMETSHNCVMEFSKKSPNNVSPIPLRRGWNWIGYPFRASQTLAAATAGILSEEGDIVVGQGGFSVFSKEKGWVGTLSSLMPGYGYMYHSANAKSLQFQKPQNAPQIRMPRRKTATENEFGFSRTAYPNVMGIVADVTMDDSDLLKQTLRLTAWAEDECRGCGMWVDGKLFVTLYGQGGETIKFLAQDTNGNTWMATEQIPFDSNVVGDLSSPYMLHLTKNTTKVTLTDERARVSAIYNLNGTYVGNDMTSLRSGLYIVRLSDGHIKKICIK